MAGNALSPPVCLMVSPLWWLLVALWGGQGMGCVLHWTTRAIHCQGTCQGLW